MPRPCGPFPQRTPVLGATPRDLTSKAKTTKLRIYGFDFHPFDAAEHRRDFAIERAVSERP
jgi:hypothetical protein